MVSDSNRIKLICGLGNPGKEYVGTRHNAGFMVIDRFVDVMKPAMTMKQGCAGIYWEGRCRGGKLTAFKPMTFMNNSGDAVVAMFRRQSLDPRELLLVYDDLDLPLGRIRIRQGGGSGGHNGVISVIERIGSDGFGRIRIGIGRSSGKLQKNYVLDKFSEDGEKSIFSEVISMAVDALRVVMYRGLNQAMNSFNGRNIQQEFEND